MLITVSNFDTKTMPYILISLGIIIGVLFLIINNFWKKRYKNNLAKVNSDKKSLIKFTVDNFFLVISIFGFLLILFGISLLLGLN